ncbi:MAG: D-alanine--D-alanine ligase [Croceibacter sp.]|nr:D-alanine--D-alanine ligase [Croceibacter sp.]
MKTIVAIAMGGYSSEFQISLNSGNVVYKHIDLEKYTPYRVHILKEEWLAFDDENHSYVINKNDFSFIKQGKTIRFDVVFNAIHGTPGEDGKLQAYLELLNIPQTACDFYSAALTFNKRDTISVLKPYGIKTATNVFINKGDTVNVNQIISKVGLPCFVKANKAGSSFGISKVYNAEEFPKALDVAFKEDDEVLVESFLDGTEVSVGVITYNTTITALPITEIVSENDFFDYEAKYNGQSQEITPARISDAQRDEVQQIAIKIYKTLKLKGLTRAEFIFHNNEPHFLEINTCPGLSEASIIPQQATEAGISLKDLFSNVIAAAIH